MLALIPLLAFAACFIVLGNLWPKDGWRSALLRSAILWGSYMILVTEVLSIFRAVTPLGLASVWAVPCLAAVGWLIPRMKRGSPVQLPCWKPPRSWTDRTLLLGVVVIVFVTGLIAWLTPPQTWDSLNYHLSRVAHWAQDRAVRHFATGIEVQNSMPPGAEMAILQFYVLAGGDRLANFVEWFAMVGSLMGVSLVAMQLGAGFIGQLVAVVFAATLPMGIVQASSTMTDYVVAFWMVCVASESLHWYKTRERTDSLVFVSLGAGLALVTKPTAFAYLLPFAVLVAVMLFRRLSLSRSFLWVLIAFLIVTALNGGHFVRNTITYHNPIGPKDRIALHSLGMINARGLLSNLLRNAGLHAGTPWPKLNKWIFTNVLKVHVKIGLGLEEPATTATGYFGIYPPNTGEDTAGNPLHAFIILIVFFLTLVIPRARKRPTLIYGLLVASTFLVFCLMFKWQVFGSRYHLPFFVLFAPAVGLSLIRLLTPRGARLVAVVMLVTSWPWLVSIRSRPLIPNEQSLVRSVLVEPRQDLYFANCGHLIYPYTTFVNMIQEEGCQTVGLMLSGGEAEYPLWVLLGAPDPNLYLEWIVSGSPSEIFKHPDFRPCAVVCGSCPQDWEEIRGLPLEYQSGGYRIFLRKREGGL